MTTLEQVKDVPFRVRVAETNAFVREIPYNDQTRKSSRLTFDFDKLANHALHNHYCISFIRCPFPLNFDSLVNHFDWCSRYLYFNFEESILRIEIFTKMENQHYDDTKLEYLIKLLKKYPQAYQYDLDDADHKQKWALLKKSNFQKNADFLRIAENDKEQRAMLLDYLRTLQEKTGKAKITDANKQPGTPSSKQLVVPTSEKREREASSYNYLKLNEELSPATCKEVIDFLYTAFQPYFHIPYDVDTFRKIFIKENSPILELIKKDNFDNQSLKIIFQALKDTKGLIVSWQVIEKKVRVFKANGTPFSGFSEVSMGKINPKKRKQQEKDMSPIIELIKKELANNKRK
ncbi:hypothetical protein [Chitinophaga arvensicola]|uniref:Uncharacterized protein n=1 Tax=Chitinophaga arvensicola TaxID=29529 RepID=A0A1I0SDT7_9BACT|nr:hypothetical protein [Chitinophaga arvensicola]SEW56459.1 hypothetical protein SAMN04488122_6672 [Chitinophaga arvensicola]